jgi:hypothetical protein
MLVLLCVSINIVLGRLPEWKSFKFSCKLLTYLNVYHLEWLQRLFCFKHPGFLHTSILAENNPCPTVFARFLVIVHFCMRMDATPTFTNKNKRIWVWCHWVLFCLCLFVWSFDLFVDLGDILMVCYLEKNFRS